METIKDGSHIPDDALADYALGRLPKRDVPGVFEHLLACDQCSERYEAELTFREDLRVAAERVAAAEAPEPRRSWLDLFAIPKPAWAAVAALVVLAAFLPVMRQQRGPLQVVELTSLRGGQTVTAPAGSRLDLRLDTTGISTANPVRVQIVDDSGDQVWNGTATAGDQKWRVQPSERLSEGRYWIRVIDPATNQQLREFELNLR
jgi:anti-sigma factor RsiW